MIENKEIEVWVDIPEYEGMYQVSNLGNVKSLERKVKHWRGGLLTLKERVLKQSISSNNYLKVHLYKFNKSKVMYIHQLVCVAFLGHKPCGYKVVVDHIDNNPHNNILTNLELTTPRHNASKDRTSSSGFTGVYWNKLANKWYCSITINKKLIHLGTFDCKLDAHNSYNLALQQHLNGEVVTTNLRKVTSKYKGVSLETRSGKWIAQKSTNGVRKYLGQFETELEAYEAILKYKKELKQIENG